MYSSEEKWKAALKESFPAEEKAIDEFFDLVNQVSLGNFGMICRQVVRSFEASGNWFKGKIVAYGRKVARTATVQ